MLDKTIGKWIVPYVVNSFGLNKKLFYVLIGKLETIKPWFLAQVKLYLVLNPLYAEERW